MEKELISQHKFTFIEIGDWKRFPIENIRQIKFSTHFLYLRKMQEEMNYVWGIGSNKLGLLR